MSEEGKVKVTDKRMFTAEGELKEEYRFLGQDTASTAEDSAGEAEAARPKPAEPAAQEAPEAQGARPEAPPLEIPSSAGAYGVPTFLDLLSTLAEPVALYLGDAKLPDGTSAENLPMARVYIDLLELLRRKTAGNLTAQEAAVLEDLLYRMKMRYVQKRG